VLKAGEELKNSAAWKNRQIMANSLAIIAWAIVDSLQLVGISIPVLEQEIVTWSEVLAGALAIINVYFTLATSKKVGL
jgi:hypothetical protein